MDQNKRTISVWVLIPATYALILAFLVLIGVPFSFGIDESSYRGGAVKMPVPAVIFAILLGLSGIGLLKLQNWGRYVFLLVAPWASIALGSMFASSLWQEDSPYTVILIFVYAPLAFMLSRFSSIQSLGIESTSWRSRGGAVVATAAVIMIIARLIVLSLKPSGGGIAALNAYVQLLVLCDIPLCNYIIALIAVSIPTRKEK